ncbi:von Willebrand factor C domain-containing protein 2-like [Callorhinchus milii]|nr:von Willebrand factor C domain-containing protein 2-like [Callorhinchus milii]|eukprot:gi/632966827/ref/XP_007899634.1/ PREDICTED: von Willebrand factor C domain-containing protein 2-like [Callorhinchus milii]
MHSPLHHPPVPHAGPNTPALARCQTPTHTNVTSYVNNGKRDICLGQCVALVLIPPTRMCTRKSTACNVPIRATHVPTLSMPGTCSLCPLLGAMPHSAWSLAIITCRPLVYHWEAQLLAASVAGHTGSEQDMVTLPSSPDLRRLRWVLAACLMLTHSAVPDLARDNAVLAKSEADYVLADYWGRGCVAENGFVFAVGARYYPSSTACPCTCTEEGPVCTKPDCPRIHPRCIRVTYQGCCPRCQKIRKMCEYGGRMFKPFQEFLLSPCERCRCEANRAVYCLTTECARVLCVNPSYESKLCCPICKQGPNCFAGNIIIPAGVKVEMNATTLCYCPYKDGSWEPQQQATCIARGRRNVHHDIRKDSHVDLWREWEEVP